MQLEAVVRGLELEQLYTDYVHCLDSDKLEHWPDFFTEDCFYRVTSAENYEAGMPLGLMPDSRYEELEATLAAGETVLFYSDGLVEAHDAQHPPAMAFEMQELTPALSVPERHGAVPRAGNQLLFIEQQKARDKLPEAKPS